MFAALLDISFNASEFITNFPDSGGCIGIMIAESVVLLAAVYYIDLQSISALTAQTDPLFDEAVLASLDADVLAEREVLRLPGNQPLRIERIRKVRLFCIFISPMSLVSGGDFLPSFISSPPPLSPLLLLLLLHSHCH